MDDVDAHSDDTAITGVSHRSSGAHDTVDPDDDMGSMLSESMDDDEDSDDDDDDNSVDSDATASGSGGSEDDHSDDTHDSEDADDEDRDRGSESSGDSADTADSQDSDQSMDEQEEIDWDELTMEEALKKDKMYRFGKRLKAGSFPQYVLQNLPSRFISVCDDHNEQTHMAPVPWKRIFYHYKEDAIKLPNNAARRTVESEYNKIDFNVTTWDTIEEKEEKKMEDGDQEDAHQGDGKEEEVEPEPGADIGGGKVKNVLDRVLQEIPNNYDDILDSSIDVHLDDIYSLREQAEQKVSCLACVDVRGLLEC